MVAYMDHKKRIENSSEKNIQLGGEPSSALPLLFLTKVGFITETSILIEQPINIISAQACTEHLWFYELKMDCTETITSLYLRSCLASCHPESLIKYVKFGVVCPWCIYW